jgi:hypothetical protein
MQKQITPASVKVVLNGFSSSYADYDYQQFGGRKIKVADLNKVEVDNIVKLYIGGNKGFASSYRLLSFPSVESKNQFLTSLA